MLWTRLMLATTSFGQDLPRPIGHELVVWEVHSASGARYSGLWRRIPQKWAHEAAARGGLSLAVLNAERQVTAKPHGLLPGLHQDNTLAESVACQSVACGRCASWTFHTDSFRMQRCWRKGAEHSSRGQSIYASTLRRIQERIDEIGHSASM